MGRWGAGNFANDCALDFVAGLVDKFVQEVAGAVAEPTRLEPDEYYGDIVPCLVTLISSLLEITGTAAIPVPDVVGRWKSTYMAVWEGYIDKVRLARGNKEERRAVLLETFDTLERQSREIHKWAAEGGGASDRAPD
jgi:hypothetical protein